MAPADAPFRVCFICSGNICRSPMAEVITRNLLEDAGLDDLVEVDSAGLGDWHVGEPADRRTVTALHEAGYDGSLHRARWFEPGWVAERDLVLVADSGHLDEVRRLLKGEDAPHVRLMRSYDPDAVAAGTLDVDDPYYGDATGFARCVREVESACKGLVASLEKDLTPESTAR